MMFLAAKKVQIEGSNETWCGCCLVPMVYCS